MKTRATDTPGEPAEVGFVRRPYWGLVLLALVLAQAAATFFQYDPNRSWRPLCDARPVMDGRHPLHLYHGRLGAKWWRDGNFGSGYDPAFWAGYPKTPVFDSGSRPAELVLLLGNHQPESYKIGLAVCCVLVPVGFVAAARLVGLHPATACLAAALGQLAWWGGPVQRLFVAGDVDWLMAGLALVLHTALLVRYHRDGGAFVWMGLLLTAALGWFCHPVLWVGFALLFGSLYVLVARRHGAAWHLGLALAWGGGLLANLGWLADWLRHCWIQRPVLISPADEFQRSLADWWAVDVGGGHADRLFAALLLGGGFLGIVGLIVRRKSATGLALGATALLLPVLSAGSSFWVSLDDVGAPKLFVIAGFFAVIPCAECVGDWFRVLNRLTRLRAVSVPLGILILAAAAALLRDDLRPVLDRAVRPRPLHLGLTVEQQTLVKSLQTATRPDARILWEERPGHPTPYWPALLPGLTQRAFLGGLDPAAGVEHSFARLTATTLAGRPLAEWSDADLDEFCRRYNVGYVVCWTPAWTERFRRWPLMHPVMPVQDAGSGWLMAVHRPPSFVLKGKAKLVQMDGSRIALSDLEPEDGVVILSLHYQQGLHVSPGNVTIERDTDPYDPIPFLRLRLPGPVLHLTLTWGE